MADLKDLGGVEGSSELGGGGGAVDTPCFVNCHLPHPQKLFVTMLCDVSLGRINIQRVHSIGCLVIQTMEFKHWNVLSLLNSDTKPCLGFGSTCLETDPNFTFLCGLGLLLLFLCYLVGIPIPTRKTTTTQKVRNICGGWEAST